MTDKQIWFFFVSTNEKVLHMLFNMANSPKKQKFEHNQRFFEEHKQLFHCFMTSRTYVYCKRCCNDISVAHGCKGDLTIICQDVPRMQDFASFIPEVLGPLAALYPRP